MNRSAMFPRRANKVPAIFFVVWGLLCLAMLIAGSYMLASGLQYRRTHQETEATVALENRRSSQGNQAIAHLRYQVDQKPFELIVTRPEYAPKERKEFNEKYQNGRQISVWYPNGEPQAADERGDRGLLIGGIAFTCAGVLFALLGGLAFVAEFFPNRFVHFG